MNYTPYKNREINMNKEVTVYFHFGKKLFSIVQGGVVVGHAAEVEMKDVHTSVSEKGRQRVLKEKRKNVHAKISGLLVGFPTDAITEGFDTMYYNPYKVDYFKDSAGNDVKVADRVIMKNAQGYFK